MANIARVDNFVQVVEEDMVVTKLVEDMLVSTKELALELSTGTVSFVLMEKLEIMESNWSYEVKH